MSVRKFARSNVVEERIVRVRSNTFARSESNEGTGAMKPCKRARGTYKSGGTKEFICKENLKCLGGGWQEMR